MVLPADSWSDWAPVDATPFLNAATAAGFTIVDLSDWYQDHKPAEVKLSAAEASNDSG